MDSERMLAVPDHVMSRQVGDETVILDLDRGTYFGLDPVGARVWELLRDSTNVKQIVATLLAEYDVPQEQLHQDVHALVDDLVKRGLVLVQ